MGLTANRNWVCVHNHCSSAYMMLISVCLLANVPLKHVGSTWTSDLWNVLKVVDSLIFFLNYLRTNKPFKINIILFIRDLAQWWSVVAVVGKILDCNVESSEFSFGVYSLFRQFGSVIRHAMSCSCNWYYSYIVFSSNFNRCSNWNANTMTFLCNSIMKSLIILFIISDFISRIMNV